VETNNKNKRQNKKGCMLLSENVKNTEVVLWVGGTSAVGGAGCCRAGGGPRKKIPCKKGEPSRAGQSSHMLLCRAVDWGAAGAGATEGKGRVEVDQNKKQKNGKIKQR